MNRSYSKIRHIQESNQRLESRLLNEQVTTQTTTVPSRQTKTITNKVASEGLKNVTTQMVDGLALEGWWKSYEFGGTFNGINYEWNCNGVEGMPESPKGTTRGMRDGRIISGDNSKFQEQLEGKITDAIPNGVWVGFYENDDHGFILYVTTSNKPKVTNF